MRILSLFVLLLLGTSTYAELVDIGIFPREEVYSFSFSPVEGEYTIFTELGKLKSIPINAEVSVKSIKDQLQLYENGILLGSYQKINFIAKKLHSYFEITIDGHSNKPARFDDNLKLFHKNGKLQLVNNIDLENYIAGVVEAEVGRLPPKEYLKLQAIICRTYALGNMHKHYLDGYNLCSEVHCQAYNGKTFYRDILSAVHNTKDIVVVDSEISLITAVFHSSCGGQTVNSEDVWTEPIYYLRSVVDTFCLDGKNASWEKTVDAESWENYLQRELPQTSHSSNLCSYRPDKREAYFMGHTQLSMKKIRKDWKLRSTYFTTERDGEKVVIRGKGFGHGVGLCQIGAMEMARRNHSYAEILHHYYKGVHLVNLNALDFFRDKP